MYKELIKRFIKPFYKIYKNRKNKRRGFRCAKGLLNKGFYYSPRGTHSFRRIDKEFFSAKNLLQFCIYYNPKQGKGIRNVRVEDTLPTDTINFGLGSGKVVLMTSNNAYGFYDTKSLYMRAKDNFLKQYKYFNYPCVRILGYDDDIKLIVMDRVKGVSLRDKLHDSFIVKELMYLSLHSKRIVSDNKEVLFLQHGDVKHENIIWSNEKYCFIDLDNIQYLPPLFDVLHFLGSCYNLHDIVELIKNHNDILYEICKLAEINSDANPLDSIFLKYVEQYKRWGCCFSDFNFLENDYVSNFPKTADFLRTIK